MENVMKALKKHVMIIVLLILLGCHHALAASGGSMGGSDFSSFGSSFSSSSTSFSSFSSYLDSSYYSSSNRKIIDTKNSTSELTVEPNSVNPLILLVPILFMLLFFCVVLVSKTKATTSVVKLQVGLVGKAKSLQRNLNIIASTADTSKSKGFRFILQETISALLQNPDYCVSAYCSLDAMNGVVESEIRFKELSAAERCKFDELTLVNFNNIRKQTATSQEFNGLPNEYIVITIIVAAWGVYELPAIKSDEKLKEALQKLSSIPSSKIMAVEVLWTPQKENDILTERQVREDYPLLHPLYECLYDA